MKFLRYISAKISALILLGSFLGVYLIDTGCTIANIANGLREKSVLTSEHCHSTPHHTQGNEHNSEDVHCHGGEHEEKTKNDRTTQEDVKNGCCKDITSVIFALVKVQPIQANYQYLTLKFTTILYCLKNFNIKVNFKLEFFSDKHPPPNLQPRSQSFRVFLQSFQI